MSVIWKYTWPHAARTKWLSKRLAVVDADALVFLQEPSSAPSARQEHIRQEQVDHWMGDSVFACIHG